MLAIVGGNVPKELLLNKPSEQEKAVCRCLEKDFAKTSDFSSSGDSDDEAAPQK